MKTLMRSPRWSLQRKFRRGQGTMELLSVIPLMFMILGIIITAGWWTYGRINAISHTYFITTQVETYNDPSRLSPQDDSWEPVTTGRPFWFDIHYTGSSNTVKIVMGISAWSRINSPFWIRGTILTVDIDNIDPNAYPFWDNPIVSKYGEPKSTLPGSFCWYCSSAEPPVSP
jgi:hypothetical protein